LQFRHPAAEEPVPARTPVYQLKITLQGSKPPVWRRILVPGNLTLDKLHDVLQVAMGWEDYHLHQFIADDVSYSTPDPEDWVEVSDERKVRLNRLLKEPGQSLLYEYDFGDSWEHTVLLEEIIKSEQMLLHPVCIAGKQACPPEDSGGIWGYEQFQEAIRDPKHPEHKEMKAWIGGGFNPEAFDLVSVNAQLQRLR
jgi:hypothetical protein